LDFDPGPVFECEDQTVTHPVDLSVVSRKIQYNRIVTWVGGGGNPYCLPLTRPVKNHVSHKASRSVLSVNDANECSFTSPKKFRPFPEREKTALGGKQTSFRPPTEIKYRGVRQRKARRERSQKDLRVSARARNAPASGGAAVAPLWRSQQALQ
jgi:hypothetical protein